MENTKNKDKTASAYLPVGKKEKAAYLPAKKKEKPTYLPINRKVNLKDASAVMLVDKYVDGKINKL